MIKKAILLSCLLTVSLTSMVRGETAIAVPTPATLNVAGGEVTLAVEIGYEAAPAAMGMELALPAGWSLVGFAGEDAPSITSRAGTTGAVECAWTQAPQGGAAFKLKLAYPAGTTATTLMGKVMLRRDGKKLDLNLTVPIGD